MNIETLWTNLKNDFNAYAGSTKEYSSLDEALRHDFLGVYSLGGLPLNDWFRGKNEFGDYAILRLDEIQYIIYVKIVDKHEVYGNPNTAKTVPMMITQYY